MSYCFGVDVGGTTIKMGLFELNGELVDQWEIITRKEDHGSMILRDVAESIIDKMTKKDIEKSDVVGIGIGIPGPVSEEGTVPGAANLGWGSTDIKGTLEDILHIDVTVGNDANVAALGEMWKGGGKGYTNLVMVTLGTGVGGGVILNGKILAGAHGSAGEIGHIGVYYEETETCGCGKKGCLEQYASATGVVTLAKRRLAQDDVPSSLRQAAHISAKTVFDAVKEGDTVAMEIAEQFGKYLGRALANISAVVDPDVIVIGGGVSRAGTVLINYIEKYFKDAVFFGNRNTKFAMAELGNDAGIIGAAKMVL